jgi:hypothetical protein
MLHVFVIQAEGSDLDGEPFEVQDTDTHRARERAANRVRDTFSLASPAMRARARAEYIRSFPSRRAYETALESGVSLTLSVVDEEYEPGVPGRGCVKCTRAWPASEPDDSPWHHASTCEVAS